VNLVEHTTVAGPVCVNVTKRRALLAFHVQFSIPKKGLKALT